MGDRTLLDNLIARLEDMVVFHDELSGTAA